MDSIVLEVLAKTTIFLMAAIVMGIYTRYSSAAFRVSLGLVTLLGCVVILTTVIFVPEPVPWLPTIPLPERSLTEIAPVGVVATETIRVEKALSLNPWLGFWFVTSCCIAWVIGRLLRARTLLSRLPNAPSSSDLDWAKIRLGTNRKIQLKEHDLSGSTFTFGLVRPLVAVPKGFAAWPRDKRRTALLHELIHISRHDFLTLSFTNALVAFFWWHPLAWVVGRNVRRDIERACDDEVLARQDGITSSAYARYLLDIASQEKRKLVTAPVVRMAAPSALRSRIEALVDIRQRRTMMQSSKQSQILVMGLVLATLVGTSGLSQVVQAEAGTDRRYMPVYKTMPVYPRDAQDQKLEGWVLLEFDVSSTGKTENISVVEASNAVFSQAAMDAVAKFRYLPERAGGQSVRVEGVRNKVTFELAKDPEAVGTDLERTLQQAAKRKLEIQREIEAAAWDAEQSADGDRLLELANYALDHNVGLASHLLLRARDIGVSDSSALQLTTAIALFKQGDLDKALAAFSTLADGSSAHKEIAGQWQVYVEREAVRRSVVHEAMLMNTGGS